VVDKMDASAVTVDAKVNALPVVEQVLATEESVIAIKPLKDTMTHAELEEAVQDLFKIGSLGLSKGEFDATPFGKSVTKIQNLILKDMMPKVKEAHKSNQEELDKLAHELRKCISTKNSQMKIAKPLIRSTRR